MSSGRYKKVIVERDTADSRLVWLKLNSPERLNILTLEMTKELYEALVEVDRDDTAQGVLLTGVGKAFCAGADVKEIMGVSFEEGLKWLTAYWRVLNLLRESGKPVVAAVRGPCVAGGNELILMCDLVVAGRSAKLGQPEVIVGSTAAGGGIQMLPLIVGEKRAREMLLTGRLLSAEEAYQYGLVNRVVADERVEEEARALALEVINKVSPQAYKVIKLGLRYWTDLAMLTWPWAKSATSYVWMSEEFKERARAFLEKKDLKPKKFLGATP